MTHQLTNEEIVRVFAMYLGCKAWSEYHYVSNPDGDGGHVYRGETEMDAETIIDFDCQYSKIKLCLTPLSGISDEHAIVLANILKYKSEEYFIKNTGYTRIDAVKKLLIEGSSGYYGGNALNITYAFQQIALWGYPVPLFFGLDHPCNGKNAIELGLAIDKTTLK